MSSPSAETTSVPTWQELLSASRVSGEFADAFRVFAENNRSNERVAFSPGNPPVKVLRALCGLLEKEPTLVIKDVAVQGASGCSDYRGTIKVNGGEKTFRFVWDCAWKARQLGWVDYFGEPDQIRAARTLGYRCFEVFEEI